ncbi:helix-turn-helix transcriptional regulator [Allostreptomyces psammosilenae]|uniref:Putative DNA-binding transcriptional regulator YafY n=1 Tax=Allostreptomyces psammosilenae TaxID=1892865 RepID=A0A852ZTH3_9ACTN|nr:YafY family protein [Allostreptomyces psammosilenae]NYI04580.1 putative DNA-binding transcriptional regulator YafY [Allostreptomyces psammosilenae]
MDHPSARTLELLSLLAAGTPRTGADLAARLGVSPRTLRRDVERLRRLGYRVESAPGTGGSYRLPAGQGMPPLLLSEEEAVATAVGLRHAAAAYGASPAGPADTALRKLGEALPARLRGPIEALLAATEVPPTPGPADHLDTVERLAEATHLRSRVRFRYTTRDGEAGERRAEPHRLLLLAHHWYLLAHHWYLLAWDEDRADWRSFRADRITGLRVPGTTFPPRPVPEQSAWPFPRPSEPKAAALFLAPAGAVARRLTARAGTLEPAGADRCRYTTGTDDWDWLAGALAAVGLPYRVEGPPELARATRDLAARAATAAGG